MLDLPNINIVGLTGMSGAGKSTVSGEFMLEDYYVINCDLLARLISSEQDFLNEVSAKFEENLIGKDGKLDRAKTAEIVFADPGKNRKYLDIILPRITFAVINLIKTCGWNNILLDAPLLFEAKMNIICGHIVSVVAGNETCISRIVARDNIPEQMARARLSAQHDEKFFRERSDFIIENSDKSLDDLEKSASEIAKKIRKGE